MIPARPGTVAYFKQTAESRPRILPVEAWDDAGVAMVVSEESGNLVRVYDMGGFGGLVVKPWVSITPGGGWLVHGRTTDEHDNPMWFVTLVVAWTLGQDGAVRPLYTDGAEVSRVPSSWTVHHPDVVEPQYPERTEP